MLVRRPNASIPPIIDRIEIVATFEAGLAEIEHRWPGLRYDIDAFAAHVRDRIFAQPNLLAMLSRLRISDLFLAWWTLCSDSGIAAFESELAFELHQIVTRFVDVDPALLVEVVRVTLFVGAEDGPRIAEYTGFGSLAEWTTVVVTQICLDAVHVLVPRVREVRAVTQRVS